MFCIVIKFLSIQLVGCFSIYLFHTNFTSL
ncbi:hypothetical protein D050_4876A, partial [Vibrio parahaemolyticus VPCR-2009]